MDVFERLFAMGGSDRESKGRYILWSVKNTIASLFLQDLPFFSGLFGEALPSLEMSRNLNSLLGLGSGIHLQKYLENWYFPFKTT